MMLLLDTPSGMPRVSHYTNKLFMSLSMLTVARPLRQLVRQCQAVG